MRHEHSGDEKYLDLCLQGPSSNSQRNTMLTQKQEALRMSIQELEDSVAYIDWKQNFYDKVLSGRMLFSLLLQSLTEAPFIKNAADRQIFFSVLQRLLYVTAAWPLCRPKEAPAQHWPCGPVFP